MTLSLFSCPDLAAAGFWEAVALMKGGFLALKSNLQMAVKSRT
jgi:hypothetical protein